MSDDPIVRAGQLGTAVFLVAAVAAVVAPDALGIPYAVLGLALFVAGSAAFLATLVKIADRSRRELIDLPGVWWLSGSAPKDVRRQLLGQLGLQIVVALAAASIRPFTALAFGVLVPTYGLGLAGLWAARSGTFRSRDSSSPV